MPYSFILITTCHPHRKLAPTGHQIASNWRLILPELTTIAPNAERFSVVRPLSTHQKKNFAFLENIDHFKKK